MNPGLLQHIADKTGGEYIQLNRAGAAERLASLLGKLDRTSETSEQRVMKKERFGLFVLLALLCLVIDTLLNAAPAATPVTVGGGVTRRNLGRGATGGDAGSTAKPGRRSRRFTAAALLLLCFHVSAFGIGDVERGNKLYNEGKYAEAVAAYQKALQSGRPTPALYYNLGTALLQLGRYEEGTKYLNSAIDGVEPNVRQNALYNLGNRFLTEARNTKDMDPNARGALLDAAADAYKRSLRLNPNDMDAKWNLEMTLRDKQKNDMQKPQEGGDNNRNPQQNDKNQEKGGGAANNQAQSPSNQGKTQGNSMAPQPLSKEQADRILSASEQDERQLTREKLRKGQQKAVFTRDW
jgi:Ca-activated chloride channel family protein